MSGCYFIGDVTYSHECDSALDYTAKTVAMGDGLTGVNTLIFDERVGILLHRNPVVNAFERVVYDDENKPPKFDGELVAITFDNERSIDALIRQLNECKDNLMKIKG